MLIRGSDFIDGGRYNCNIPAVVKTAAGRVYCLSSVYVVGDVDVDTLEGVVTASFESLGTWTERQQ